MPTITDYHAQVRDAVRDVLAAIPLSVPVVALEDPETDMAAGINMPAVVVACIGPEQDRPEMETNVRDGTGYSVSVSIHSNSVTSGATAPNVPSPTEFRRLVRTTFNNKRLAGMAMVGWCEVSELGELYGKDTIAFQSLKSGFAVTAVGRFARTDS